MDPNGEMLAGVPGVIPDRMIIRFVADALGLPRRRATSDFAVEAVLAAPQELNMSPTDLDHGIWSWQRRQRSGTRDSKALASESLSYAEISERHQNSQASSAATMN